MIFWMNPLKNIPLAVGVELLGAKIAIDAEVKVLYQENEKDIIGQYVAAVFHNLLNCLKHA